MESILIIQEINIFHNNHCAQLKQAGEVSLSLLPEYLSTCWQAAVCGAQLSRRHIASGEKKSGDFFFQ